MDDVAGEFGEFPMRTTDTFRSDWPVHYVGTAKIEHKTSTRCQYPIYLFAKIEKPLHIDALVDISVALLPLEGKRGRGHDQINRSRSTTGVRVIVSHAQSERRLEWPLCLLAKL